jgi:hypothetical protein
MQPNWDYVKKTTLWQYAVGVPIPDRWLRIDIVFSTLRLRR